MNLDNTISTVASALGIIGALLIAMNINMFLEGYLTFLASAFLWSVYAWRADNRQLLVMNLVFTCINGIGVYNFI